jgi:hypothetical protein
MLGLTLQLHAARRGGSLRLALGAGLIIAVNVVGGGRGGDCKNSTGGFCTIAEGFYENVDC